MSAWEMFFAAQLGASAALTGLLFVGISINMPRIIAIPTLPDLALRALVLLVQVLFVSSLMLVPNISSAVLGVALLVTVVGGGAASLALANRIRLRSEKPYRTGAVWGQLLAAVIAVLYVAAAMLIFRGWTDGPDVLVSAFLLSFLVTINDAWVLLLEINR